MDTFKVGKLVGLLMKELLEDEQFHKGYQEALTTPRHQEVIDTLKKAHKEDGMMINIKVTCIKRFRELTGVGLKEAKDAVEEIMDKIKKGDII